MSNLSAFLDMIALSELGATIVANSDRGYDVLVGSTPGNILRFTSYATHPNVFNRKLDSTAAGRYQIIHGTWFSLCRKLGVSDFSPETQDKMAIELIRGRDALDDVNAGNFEDAVTACSEEWASLPGGDSGQHENSLALLQQYYTNAGGILT